MFTEHLLYDPHNLDSHSITSIYSVQYAPNAGFSLFPPNNPYKARSQHLLLTDEQTEAVSW